jgi:hypothetical protein
LFWHVLLVTFTELDWRDEIWGDWISRHGFEVLGPIDMWNLKRRISSKCMHVILMHTQIVPSIYILHGLCIISEDQLNFLIPPSYLLSFFSKYECWAIDLIMPSFYFFGLSLALCIMRFHSTMKCEKWFIWVIFIWNLFGKHRNN